MERYRDEEREFKTAQRPTVLSMVIISHEMLHIHDMESSGGEEDSLESGDSRSFRIAVSCFFLSMGVCN